MNIYNPGISSEDQRYTPLHRNENLFVDKKWLLSLAQETLTSTYCSYYPDLYCSELRNAIAKSYGLTSDHIYIGNGADGVLADVLCVLRKKYQVLYTRQFGYKIYKILADRYEFDFKNSSDAFHQLNLSNSVYALDSPGSITGASLDLPVILPKNSFFIWDNVYGEFAQDRIPTSIPENLVIVRSFSKYYGLASLRIGYCIGHPEFLRDVVAQKDIFNVNGFAQKMALRMLGERQVLQQCCEAMWSCKKTLEAFLQGSGFNLSPSQANFVFVTHPDHSAQTIEELLLHHGFLVRRFSEPFLSNHLRITVPPKERLTQLMETLEVIFERSLI